MLSIFSFIDPSIITGLRIAVKSLIDLASSNPSPEMELIVRQVIL